MLKTTLIVIAIGSVVSLAGLGEIDAQEAPAVQAQAPGMASTAAAQTLSPDGAIIGPPESLTTADGTWMFGSPADSNNWYIILNGQSAAGGFGSKIAVDNGGQLYVLGLDNNWWVYQSGSWVRTSAPAHVQAQAPAVASTTAAQTLSPDGAIIGPPESLTTADGTWMFGSQADSNNWYIVLNGQSAAGGFGSKLAVDNGGRLYVLGLDNNWWVYQSGSWSLTSDYPTPPFTCRGLNSDLNVYRAPTTVPFPKVGYLQSYIDPVFLTRITRVTGDPGTAIPGGGTWGTVVHHQYSKVQAWNADESLIFIPFNRDDGGSGGVFIDGTTYQPVFSARCPGGECRWYPTDPNRMVWARGNQIGDWFPRTGAVTTVATFSGYSNLLIGPHEGNLSLSGTMIVLSGRNSAGADVAFAYNLANNIKYSDVLVNNYGARLNWASISPAGDYLVMAFSNGGSDRPSVVLDLNGNQISRTNPSQPTHYDMSIDDNGDEVGVGSNRPGGGSPINGRVIKFRLKDGEVTPITLGGFARHTSTRDTALRNWAVSSMEPTRSFPPYDDEIDLIKLDGSVVYRLAHTYNNMTDYNAEVIPSISPSGTRVIFQSNWESPTGRPTQVYVIDLRPNCSVASRAEQR